MNPELRELHGHFPCPGCGRDNQVLGGVNRRGPKPGDVVVCVACLIYLVINDDHTLRKMTDHEWLQLTPLEREIFTEARERIKELDIEP